MVTTELVFVGLAALLAVLTAIVTHRYEKYVQRQTTVSTFKIGQLAPSNPIRQGLLMLLAALLAGVIILFVFVDNSSFIWIIALVCLLVWSVVRVVLLLFYVVTAKASNAVLTALSIGEIHKFKPEFAFHFSGPHMLDPYHVTMWLDHLNALNRKFVIILRDRKHLDKLPRNALHNAIFLASIRDVSLALPSSCKAIFYANNSMKNMSVIKKFPKVQHIQLLHGDSDKPPSFHPTAIAYSKLFVAGEMAIDRYHDNGVSIPKGNFKIVGRPQLSYDIGRPGDNTNKRNAVIAYMSTCKGSFEDVDFSSFGQSYKIVSQLIKSKKPLSILFKPHPISYKDPDWSRLKRPFSVLEASAAKGKNSFTMIDRTHSPFDLYKEADVLITDISSTIIDFLHSGKPFLVTNPKNFGPEMLKKFPSLRGGYMINADLSNLEDMLNLALGEDPIRAERLAVRDYAFGDIGLPPGELFRKAVLDVLDENSGDRRPNGQA